MKRTRTKKKKASMDLFGGWVDAPKKDGMKPNLGFNKENNKKPPSLPQIAVKDGVVIQMKKAGDGKVAKRVPKGLLLGLWEFLYERKWYIDNHYAADKRDMALFELNLYLKVIEKRIIKKYGKERTTRTDG